MSGFGNVELLRLERIEGARDHLVLCGLRTFGTYFQLLSRLLQVTTMNFECTQHSASFWCVLYHSYSKE